MITTIYPKHTTTEKFWVRQFYDGSEWLPTHEYPCDRFGQIIFDDDASLWIEKYLQMVADGVKSEVTHYYHDVMQPAYVECDCGNRFFLTAKRGRTCTCSKCKKSYDIYLEEQVKTPWNEKGGMTA